MQRLRCVATPRQEGGAAAAGSAKGAVCRRRVAGPFARPIPPSSCVAWRRRWEPPMARERPARLSPAAAGSRASVSAATGGLDALVGLRRARRSR